MKQILFSFLIVIAGYTSTAQSTPVRKASLYEAANWKPRLIDAALIKTAAPPSAAATANELKTLKQKMGNLSKQSRQAIVYWNAGAPAYRWNQIAPQLMDQKPDSWLRIPTAWINIAIYDATILAWKEKLKYKRKRPHQEDASVKPLVESPLTYSYPCEHSVTAAAAANLLAYFFPDKKDSIIKMGKAAAQSRIDAGLQYPSDVAAGWELGDQVAKQIIEKAKKDGSATTWNGTINQDPKKWTGKYPFGITMATMVPLVLQSPDQFRPGPPPDFASEMKELKEFKQTFKSKSIGFYWANHGGFDFWSDVAAEKLFEYRLMDNAPVAARVYAVLHSAYHDAAIAIMDAKYAYWGIRPNQYDTTFTPLVATPPFPGYPSGHAAGAATTSAVMEYFFPADAAEFRKYAAECAVSRFYAGIHFRSDNEAGLKMGEALGKYVVETWVNDKPASGESGASKLKLVNNKF